MTRIAIAVMLAALLLLMTPTAVSTTSGVVVVSKTGDGGWIDNAWEVNIYPGESKSTAIKLYNSSSSPLDVWVTILLESLDEGNLTFELDKSSFTIPGKRYTNVILSVEEIGRAHV